MSKKSKKFDADTNAVEQAAPAVETTTEAAAPAPKVEKPALPSYHLEGADGTNYRFIRYALPKRSLKVPEGDLQLSIAGYSTPAWKTDSKGWSVEGTELTYVYFTLPVGDGIDGYIVLQGEELGDDEFVVGDGDGNRPNPKAQSKLTDEQKAARIAAAQATREANKAKATAATGEAAEPVGTTEGVGLIG